MYKCQSITFCPKQGFTVDKDQMKLFSTSSIDDAPLAFKQRPLSFEHFVGQNQIINRINNLDIKNLPHIVFFGPPGSGKTTLAAILASEANLEIFNFNAVLGGVKELREIISTSIQNKSFEGKKSIIFIDEIHRFNKGQQDALLPHLEKGDFVLFGATTENPNVTLNKAILSRVQRWRFNALNSNEILEILKSACVNSDTKINFDLLNFIAVNSNGDARSSLNHLEVLFQNVDKIQDLSTEQICKQYLFENRRYDKDSERHYDVISAFIKSIRGSDANAAILWLAAMLDGGEDIEFIARRLIISASEDIGNADPRALQVATNAHYAIKQIGMPEARLILAQATSYLANAPKSNASYLAINEALAYVKSNPTIEVPTHLRNHHPNKKQYKYPHNYENHWVDQDYLDKNLDARFYKNTNIGYEKMMENYLQRIKK